jgi:hypothetical protein
MSTSIFMQFTSRKSIIQCIIINIPMLPFRLVAAIRIRLRLLCNQCPDHIYLYPAFDKRYNKMIHYPA